MPMGLVSDEDLEREIKRNPSIILPKKNEHGRNEGDVNVPESVRKLIAQDSIENGRSSALELADSLGISKSSVSAYSNGATSTTSYNEGNKELRTHNNEIKDRITRQARSKLLSALKNITPDKLSHAKLKDVSGVARDMSAIIKNLEPQAVPSDNNAPKVNIVLFAPQRKHESDYETIVVNE